MTKSSDRGLHFVLISVHGLIRGLEPELGRDADTGGQVKYVLELAHALAARPEVRRVDLLTRRIVDPEVSDDYARPVEKLSHGANIIRVDAGPAGYLRKEELWEHLESFADNTLAFLRELEEPPDLVHGHYADAGHVGIRVASQLNVPLVFTGHSLGRVKRQRLRASGMTRDAIEERYNITRRIEAEEDTLGVADLVITSTQNEIEEQYGLYDHYHPGQMVVVPPGTDLERFTLPTGDEWKSAIADDLRRFLSDPEKPVILALSRPDERKNISSLIDAYGESSRLQEIANLVIVAGNRDEIGDMDDGARRVMTQLLLAIDQYDLYGKVAYPKHHVSDDVPIFYRLAAASRGIFINPALTEPFGLTLLEAAASGLPVVATEDGGPTEIIANCGNGVLVNPTDTRAIEQALLDALEDEARWNKRATAGLAGVREHYSWKAHVDRYLAKVAPLLEAVESVSKTREGRHPMLQHNRAVFTDLDQNLLGDRKAIAELVRTMREHRRTVSFGISTGRRLVSALRIMRQFDIPIPDVLITSVGTQMHYGRSLTPDSVWQQHIDHLWTPHVVGEVLAATPGMKPQARDEQSRYKISYYYDPSLAPPIEELQGMLRRADQSVNTFVSFGQFLDITPVRASKGLALRYFADKWEIPLERILAAGGSGTDEDMMLGNTLAVVVNNRHDEELSHLPDIDRIYFSEAAHAWGILEAMEHYDFFGECVAHDSSREGGGAASR